MLEPDSRVVAIRGTEGALEWVDDAAALSVPFHQAPSAGRVAYGFDRIYATLKVIKRTLPDAPTPVEAMPTTYAGSFAEQLEQLAITREKERGLESAPLAEQGRPRRKRPTIVTGHSLGAALATLFVMENDEKGKFDVSRLCTFASPASVTWNL